MRFLQPGGDRLWQLTEASEAHTFAGWREPVSAYAALVAIAAETDAATTVALMAASLAAVTETAPALVMPLSRA